MRAKLSGLFLVFWLALPLSASASDFILADLEQAQIIIKQALLLNNNMQNTIKLQANSIAEQQITINNLKVDNENLIACYEKQIAELKEQLKTTKKKLNESKARVTGLSILTLLLIFIL